MKLTMIQLDIEPMGKPRMTQRDKWKKRPAVVRFHAFRDYVRLKTNSLDISDAYSVSWTAYFSMPKSWSNKKKEELKGQAHRQKPDRDNIDKAILDSLMKEDSGISEGKIIKRWDDGDGARIELVIK